MAGFADRYSPRTSVACPGHRADRAFDVPALAFQHTEILTEELDGDLRLHSGRQFVDTGRDRLTEVEQDTRMLRQIPLQLGYQILARSDRLPVLDRLEADEDLGIGNPLGVAAQLSPRRMKRIRKLSFSESFP